MASYDTVDFWYSEIKKNDQNEMDDFKGMNNIIVLANKCDLAKDNVNTKEFANLK